MAAIGDKTVGSQVAHLGATKERMPLQLANALQRWDNKQHMLQKKPSVGIPESINSSVDMEILGDIVRIIQESFKNHADSI
jgi:ABC-type arginine transport system ATPase subunit